MNGRTISIPGASAIRGLESRMESVDGVDIHYWIGGDRAGRPIVLWHGFLGTAYAWAQVAPRLVDAGYRVLVPDMLGFGDSDKPEGNVGYDARALADRFRSLVRSVGMADLRLLLVAHDMGAPPALIWASDHPSEVAGLVYIEAPVMLSSVLQGIITYTPEAMSRGSMWWWIVPLAPGVVERLIVGHERQFLTWFYETATADDRSVSPESVDEYLRTFNGREGVLGTMGVYRTAFMSIEQTEQLVRDKVACPILAIGGEHGLGKKVGPGVRLVANDVTDHTLTGCGHFVPEECPADLTDLILRFAERTTTKERLDG